MSTCDGKCDNCNCSTRNNYIRKTENENVFLKSILAAMAEERGYSIVERIDSWTIYFPSGPVNIDKKNNIGSLDLDRLAKVKDSLDRINTIKKAGI